MRVRHAVSSIDSERSMRALRSLGPMLGGATDATGSILPHLSTATAQSIGVGEAVSKANRGGASGARAHVFQLVGRDEDLARL